MVAPRNTSSENRRDGAEASRVGVTGTALADVDIVIGGGLLLQYLSYPKRLITRRFVTALILSDAVLLDGCW